MTVSGWKRMEGMVVVRRRMRMRKGCIKRGGGSLKRKAQMNSTAKVT